MRQRKQAAAAHPELELMVAVTTYHRSSSPRTVTVGQIAHAGSHVVRENPAQWVPVASRLVYPADRIPAPEPTYRTTAETETASTATTSINIPEVETASTVALETTEDEAEAEPEP